MKATLFSFALAAILAGGAPATAIAQTTAPTNIDDLITELSSADFARREQAEADLVARGVSVVPAIQQVISTTDDIDLKERLHSAVSRIDREQMLLPTLVTIDRTFATPLEAFTAVARAAELRVEIDPEIADAANAPTPVAIKVRDEPWLVLLNRTIVLAGIGARMEDGRLVLVKQEKFPRDPPTAVSGSVLMMAEVARRRSSHDITRDVSSSHCSLTLALLCEPKTRFRGNGPAIVIKNVLDENGKPIPNTQRGQFSRQSARRLIASLSFTGPRIHKVSVLEGELHGEVVSRIDEQRIDNLQKLPATLSSAVYGDVTFVSLAQKEKNWLLTGTASITPNTGNSAIVAELEAAVKSQAFEVLDQNGKPMTCTLKQTGNNGLIIDLQITMTSTDAAARPAKARWFVPSQTREVKIPFVLRDMPLP